MVKHTKTIRRQLFESVWHFVKLALKGLKQWEKTVWSNKKESSEMKKIRSYMQNSKIRCSWISNKNKNHLGKDVTNLNIFLRPRSNKLITKMCSGERIAKLQYNNTGISWRRNCVEEDSWPYLKYFTLNAWS